MNVIQRLSDDSRLGEGERPIKKPKKAVMFQIIIFFQKTDHFT
jgi:hypothetical protein